MSECEELYGDAEDEEPLEAEVPQTRRLVQIRVTQPTDNSENTKILHMLSSDLGVPGWYL